MVLKTLKALSWHGNEECNRIAMQDKRIKAHKQKGQMQLASGLCCSWWALLGSNQRPLPCEGSALPLS